MPKPQHLLIRHPSVSVKKGTCYGRLDVPLSQTATQEGQALCDQLANQSCTQIFSSPSKRCLMLANQLGGPIIQDPRLLELNFGEWEGLHWDDIHRPAADAWFEDYYRTAPPEGEAYQAMIERVIAFKKEHLDRAESPIWVITHAGVIRILQGLVSGEHWQKWFELPVPFASPIPYAC